MNTNKKQWLQELKAGDEVREVFRTSITVDGRRCGKIGFDREDGVDLLHVVSYHGGEMKAVNFELEAGVAVAALIFHAMKTRTRPPEGSCFSFPEPTAEQLERIAAILEETN